MRRILPVFPACCVFSFLLALLVLCDFLVCWGFNGCASSSIVPLPVYMPNKHVRRHGFRARFKQRRGLRSNKGSSNGSRRMIEGESRGQGEVGEGNELGEGGVGRDGDEAGCKMEAGSCSPVISGVKVGHQ